MLEYVTNYHNSSPVTNVKIFFFNPVIKLQPFALLASGKKQKQAWTSSIPHFTRTIINIFVSVYSIILQSSNLD